MEINFINEVRALTNKRNDLIDSIKGLAILLVVLGHSIQLNLYDFDNNLLFKYIYSFHMPLFMFISGYLAWSTFDGSIGKLKKRFISLIIPFVTWATISCLFYQYGISFFLKLIKSPDLGLWFLLVLFEAYLLLFIAKRLKFENVILVTLLGGLYYSGRHNFLGLNLLSWFFLFFCAGYFLAKYKNNVLPYASIFGYLSLVLFPILAYFWSRNGNPIFVSIFNWDHFPYLKLLIHTYRSVVAFLGIAFVITILRYSPNVIRKCLFVIFGMFTLEIYALQWYFLKYFKNLQFNEPLKVIISFIGCLAFCLIAIILIKQSRVLNLLLFGKNFKFKPILLKKMNS